MSIVPRSTHRRALLARLRMVMQAAATMATCAAAAWAGALL